MNTDLYEPLKTLCERRKSIRKFSSQPVSSETVQKIIQLATTSPYASGRKNWEIAIIEGSPLIQQLAEAVRSRVQVLKAQIRAGYQAHFEAYAHNFSLFETAPLLLIPTFRISFTLSPMICPAEESLRLWERDNYVKSISCVALLILLAAESLGLGGCYMTGPLIAEEQLTQLIGIKPGRNIGAIIPIGYKDLNLGLSKKVQKL